MNAEQIFLPGVRTEAVNPPADAIAQAEVQP